MEIIKFTFGPFSENTYVLVDMESKECIIIDPGMYDSDDRAFFKSELTSAGLKPTMLLNTHCHIDHVMGNSFVYDTYGLVPQIHEKAVVMLERAPLAAQMYGLNYDPSPEGESTLTDGRIIDFHGHLLQVLFTPGHAPGHVVFYNEKEQFVINGDVLFKGSVGRTDLPGSHAPDLVKSIQDVMYNLPDATAVFTGHGPETTIGEEKISNSFVTASESSLS